MPFDISFLDPTSSGSKGTKISATYQSRTDTLEGVAAEGYFNEAFDELRRVGAMRVFATDGWGDFDVALSAFPERVVTITLREATLDEDGLIPPSQLPRLDNFEFNLVNDFGAVGDGTNDHDAFQAFQDEMGGVDRATSLYMPPPRSYFTDSILAFSNIRRLIVWAYGAEFAGAQQINAQGIQFGSTYSALVETVAAGATQVECIPHSEASKFIPGRWGTMTGVALQRGGYPPNFQFFEHVKFFSSNATTGIVVFTKPIRNAYKSTWPRYDPRSGSDYDDGGPATLYALPENWDIDHSIFGLHFNAAAIFTNGRRLAFNDVSFDGLGISASQNREFILRGSSRSGDGNPEVNEMDKLTELVTIEDRDCSTIEFQSASIERCAINRCFVTGQLLGSPKHLDINDSFVSQARFGARGYGASETVTARSSHFGAILPTGIISDVGSVSGNDLNQFTFPGGGVIQCPAANPVYPQRVLVPGGRYYFCRDSEENQGLPFIVTDIRKVGSDILWDTTLPDPMPAFTGGVTPTRISAYPGWRWTFDNCSGCDTAVSQSKAPPGSPPFSYVERTITGSPREAPYVQLWGGLRSIKVNVIRPYTGPEAACLVHLCGPVGCQTRDMTTWVYAAYDPIINAKVAGIREITPDAVVNAQAGDVLGAAPGRIWFVNGVVQYFTTDISAEAQDKRPIIYVTFDTTDHGIVSVANFMQASGISI